MLQCSKENFGPRVYVHIGLPRAASTFLQTHFFQKLPEWNYVGKEIDDRLSEEIIRTFAALQEMNPDLNQQFCKLRQEAVDLLQLGVARGNGRSTVFSWEGFVGFPGDSFRGFSSILNILREALPMARIILCTRRQDSWFESLYRHHVRIHRWGTIEQFLNWMDGDFSPVRSPGGVGVYDLDLARMVEAYMAAFGRDQVLVLPYEWLEGDRLSFVNTLACFMGVELPPINASHIENRGLSAFSIAIARRLNRLMRTPANPNGIFPVRPFEAALRSQSEGNRFARMLLSVSRVFDPPLLMQQIVDRIYYMQTAILPSLLRQRIMEIHSPSNRRLAESTGLDLRALGYFSEPMTSSVLTAQNPTVTSHIGP